MTLSREDIQAIVGPINERLDGMDKRLDSMDKRFEGIDKRFDGIDYQLKYIKQRTDRIENKLNTVSMKADLNHKAIEDLKYDLSVFSHETNRRLLHLEDVTETLAAVLEQKNILPRAL